MGAYPHQITADEIRITAAARAELARLMRQSGTDSAGIRVYVSGGGPEGLSCAMSYAEEVTAYDSVLDCGDFKVIVDAVALNYLHGCQIDCFHNGIGTRFIFHNVFQSVGGRSAAAD